MSADRNEQNEAALRAWLDAARADLGSREPPAWLQFQVRDRLAERAALDAVRGVRAAQPDRAERAPSRWLVALGRRLRPPRRWPALAAVAGACVALLVGFAVLVPLPPPPADGAQAWANGERSPFIALATLDAIAAESEARVVRAQLPRTSLAEFGLPMDPARADVPLSAEFLMSPRGLVLAVRFLE